MKRRETLEMKRKRDNQRRGIQISRVFWLGIPTVGRYPGRYAGI